MTKPRDGEPSTATLRAAVLGSPISHSKSPRLHRAAYRAAGLPWRYDAIDVMPADLAHFVGALGPRWVGLSLTMPLKQAVLPLVDELDASASRTQAVNTVVLPGSPRYPGRVIGYNTDVKGIVEAVRNYGVDGIGSVEVLGSGATARSALAAAADLGARAGLIRARNARAAEELGSLAQRWGYTDLEIIGLDSERQPGQCDLTISALPKGAADALVGRLSDAGGALLDVVYEPWPTPLAAAWPGVVVPGLEMLVCQAAHQVRLMAGIEPDLEAMRESVAEPSHGASRLA